MSGASTTASSYDPTAPGWMQHREHDGEEQPSLTTVLLELKKALRETIEHAKEEEKLLKVKECTVELGITWTIEGSGEVKFWVLDFTGKGTRENAQTMTVTLEPAGGIPTEFIVNSGGDNS